MTSQTNDVGFFADGWTFDYDRDGRRLGKQMRNVMSLMLRLPRGKRMTLKDIAQFVGAPEASVSARLRDMRKPRFGSHDVRREYIGNGLHVYWVEP